MKTKVHKYTNKNKNSKYSTSIDEIRYFISTYQFLYIFSVFLIPKSISRQYRTKNRCFVDNTNWNKTNNLEALLEYKYYAKKKQQYRTYHTNKIQLKVEIDLLFEHRWFHNTLPSKWTNKQFFSSISPLYFSKVKVKVTHFSEENENSFKLHIFHLNFCELEFQFTNRW